MIETHASSSSPSWDELLSSQCEGMLSDAESRLFESMLLTEPAFRRQYVLYMNMYSSLHWTRGSEMPGKRAAVHAMPFSAEALFAEGASRAISSEREALSEGTEPIARGPLPAVRSVALRGINLMSRPRLLSALSAAVVVLLLVTAMAFLREPAEYALSRLRGLENDSNAVAIQGVAQLTRETNCRWEGEATFFPGMELPVGQLLALKRGIVEVRFARGATVILEGPVDFIIENDNCGRLRLGRLVARVNREAIGFTVNTPAVKLVDLGTEFGVCVSEAGETELHVFEGDVEVQSRESDAASNVPAQNDREILTAGEAARFSANDSNGGRVATAVPLAREEFLRQFPSSKPALRRWSAYRKWQASLVEMRSDPSLILHYTFDRRPAASDSAQITNQANNAAANTALILGSSKVGAAAPQLVPGRWNDKHSLHFSPEHEQYALLPQFPLTATGELTVAAWVWAESRQQWGTIAKNWGPNPTGQFHFGLYELEGDLDVHVLDRQGRQISAREGRNNPFPLNSWQFAAFTVDGKSLKLYRNGAKVGQRACDGLLADPKISWLSIGAKLNEERQCIDNCGWNGRIDEVAVFHRALSAEEIEKLFRVGNSAGKDRAFNGVSE